MRQLDQQAQKQAKVDDVVLQAVGHKAKIVDSVSKQDLGKFEQAMDGQPEEKLSILSKTQNEADESSRYRKAEDKISDTKEERKQDLVADASSTTNKDKAFSFSPRKQAAF